MFLEKHNLNSNSRPVDWFAPWVPMQLTGEWSPITNTKALLANAGQEGFPYPDFKTFKVKELRQHIGVVMLQGIAPSPQVS